MHRRQYHAKYHAVRDINRRALLVLPGAAVLLATLLGLLAVAGSCDPSGPVRPAHPLVRLTPDVPAAADLGGAR